MCRLGWNAAFITNTADYYCEANLDNIDEDDFGHFDDYRSTQWAGTSVASASGHCAELLVYTNQLSCITSSF